MRPLIDTARFYRSHLRAPRGRGSWIFENHAGTEQYMARDEASGSCSLTYGEACKLARAEAARRGWSVAYVCP